MNCELQCSDDAPQMNLTGNVPSEQRTRSEETNFSRDEQVSFNFTTFDPQPFVAIEYDDGDQPDPLAVDETVDIANLVIRSGANRKIKIYHPFSQEVDEFCESSLSRSPDSFYLCSPPKVGKSVDLRDSGQEEVIVISDGDDDINPCPESFQSQTESSDKNMRDDVDRNIQNRSSLVSLIDDVILDDNASQILMKKVAEQMLIKIEERRLAANHLKQKRMAETAFARQLARQIMKAERRLPQNSPVSVERAVPTTRKQWTAAESALARRLVREMSKGCSLDEATVALRSITSSLRPTPVNSVNGTNRRSASGRLVAGAPDGSTRQGPPDEKTPQPQQLETQHINLCFVRSGTERWDQSMPNGDHHNIPAPWPSNATSSQQVLPPYTVAFNRPNYCHVQQTKPKL